MTPRDIMAETEKEMWMWTWTTQTQTIRKSSTGNGLMLIFLMNHLLQQQTQTLLFAVLPIHGMGRRAGISCDVNDVETFYNRSCGR